MIDNKEWVKNVKKYLEPGDIKDVAKELSVSESLVYKVIGKGVHNLSVMTSLIDKAEMRKLQKEALLKRVEAL